MGTRPTRNSTEEGKQPNETLVVFNSEPSRIGGARGIWCGTPPRLGGTGSFWYDPKIYSLGGVGVGCGPISFYQGRWMHFV